MVLGRAAFNELRDSLYRLEASAEDAALDATESTSVGELRGLMASLVSEISAATHSLPEPSAES